MKHIIMTRMGLGMALPDALWRRARFLVETLLPCLSQQTDPDFTWVVVTDTAIDPRTEAYVREAFARFGNFHLEKVDTFSAKLLQFAPHRMCDKYMGATKDLLVTQIDDDDALAIDFVAEAKTAARTSNGFAAISFQNGLLLHPQNRQLVSTSVRSSSVGLTMLTPDVKRWNPVRGGHSRAHERIVKHGGQSLLVETNRPYWMQVIYSFSDSREIRAPQVIDEGFAGRGQPVGFEALARFALSESICDVLAEIVSTTGEPRAPIHGSGMKRMALKQRLLDLAKTAEQELVAANGDEAVIQRSNAAIAALKAAYYAF